MVSCCYKVLLSLSGLNYNDVLRLLKTLLLRQSSADLEFSPTQKRQTVRERVNRDRLLTFTAVRVNAALCHNPFTHLPFFYLKIFEYISPGDCNYPPEFLLSIFDEERDENFTTAQPPTTTTRITTRPTESEPVGQGGSQFPMSPGRVRMIISLAIRLYTINIVLP